ncbi:MAG TPA: NlpC/P60 family protein [Actinocrinis sp.]|nr:NlpC/P60 family protein [Actinocrinis sp.]
MASHRRVKPQTRSVMAFTASSAVAAAGVVVLTPVTSQAATIDQVKAEVLTLENQADAATQRYDQAENQLSTLQQQVDDLQGQAATAQQTYNKLSQALGPLAASQYEAGSVNPTLELMLSQNPEQYLQEASSIDETNQNTVVQLNELKVDKAQVASLQAAAGSRLVQLQQVQSTAAADLKSVQSALTQQRNLYSQLTYVQMQSLAVNGVTVAEIQALPTYTGRVAQVIAFERSKLGLPYLYGGTGPLYDCSGLVQAAYKSAGIAVPRTTFDYEDENFGTTIPADLSQMKPGDLVFYNHWDHVATYVGNGLVIQSPTTGQFVDYAPWNMMAISSIRRIIND